MKKCSPLIYHTGILSIFVLVALITQGLAGGVAAFKDQKFHADASATIMVYTELIVGSAPFVKVITGPKTVTIDRQKLAGNVEVMLSLPDNITNDEEIKPLRISLDAIKSFSARYPKSAAILQGHVTTLEKSINQFNSGQVRYNREWMEKTKHISILEEKNIQLEKIKLADSAIAAENQKRREEAEKFAAEQRANGLEIYGDKWFEADPKVRPRKS